MIVFEKNSTNNIVVTVSQDTNTNYSYYLFVFTSLMNTATVSCTAQDTSTAHERYNLFSIEETSGAVSTSGQVFFTYAGDYYYEIYGKWENDLTVPNATALLESGYARVEGTPYTYNSPDIDYTNKAYDPNE